jgi:hypothetical protein
MTEDAIDAMIERTAREEQEELDRAHGQHILDATAARLRQGSAEDLLLEVLSRAHKAKAEADER